jgi:hypothetical protein
MPRIYTDQPSAGSPLNIYVPATMNSGFVNTDWTELAEAPDFSIPSTGISGAVADGSDPTNREIRPGEIYFESPLIAYNGTGTSRWVQLEMALPSPGSAFESGHFIPAGPGGGASGRVFMCPRVQTNARIYDVATNTVITPSTPFPPEYFLGSVKLSDNRIYMIPWLGGTNATARIYNPVTDTFSTPSGTFPVLSGQYSGVLLADGRVFIIPFYDTVARIYDPATDTLTVAGGTYAGNNPHLSGVRLASGKVFMPPCNAGRAAVYDPATNTKTEVGPTYGPEAFRGAVLLNNGKVFMVPFAASRGAVYDPAGSGTITDVDATKWAAFGQFPYNFGALLPDGRVYMNGAFSVLGRIWDPATDTSTIPAGLFSGDLDHFALVTLADGKIFLVPHNSTTAKIYNSVANTLTTPAGDYPSAAERVTLTGQLAVPANGTVSIPIQGQRLLCRAQSSRTQGGKLLIRAEVNNAIKVFGSAIELEAASHAPNTED